MRRKIFFAIFLFIGMVEAAPIVLQVKESEIIVQGRRASVYEIKQSDGTQGIYLNSKDFFDVVLDNQLKEPTSIHWHGLILPSDQDGVPYVSQAPIPMGGKHPYHFPLVQSGTYWMHSHFGLQEQKLLAAPLIIYDSKERSLSEQEVIMFLEDFTFKDPQEIYSELRQRGMGMGRMMGQQMMRGPMRMMHAIGSEVDYDAYLTNRKTLENPDVVRLSFEKPVRLRVINGSATTNFFISFGELEVEAIAVDGSDIEPIKGSRFEVAVGQRMDFRIKIPIGANAYPILAQGEGKNLHTGLILATKDATILKLQENTFQPTGALSYNQEKRLKAKNPLSKKKIDRRLVLRLGGGMHDYIWTLNGRAWPDNSPLYVKEGERVELVFVNESMMSHPMHLHGHTFQVTEIDREPLSGALRDTVLVLPGSIVKVQFDANNPGNWALHCHYLYHMNAGMMTTLTYDGYKGPVFEKKPH